MRLVRAMNVLSSPDGDVTTTAKGSPFWTRVGTHQPSASLVPRMTSTFAAENTRTFAPGTGRPVVNDITHTPRRPSLARTESPRSETQTRRYVGALHSVSSQ